MSHPPGARRSLAARILLWAAAALFLVGAAASAILLVAARREYVRRTNLYWYDVERDQEIQLGTPDRTMLVEVDREGFDWPAATDACDTAFLQLRIDSTPTALWFEPVVRAEAGDIDPFEQHLERGARGTRYLNLSPLCGQLAPGDRVALGGRFLAWEPQPAALYVFRNPERDAEPLLVLAPHPDDAEIAAFGLYRSRRSVVVTLMAGDYAAPGLGHLVADPDEQTRLRGRLRSWDSVAVPLWGGVRASDALNLGYLNGLLEAMHDRPEAEVGSERGGTQAVRSFRRVRGSRVLDGREPESSWNSLVDDLEALLQGVAPSLIVAPHPLLDASADHGFTTVALLDALRRVDGEAATLLLYTNHAVGTEYHPFGPADSLVTLPPSVGEPFFLPGIYSHPLAPDAQLDKLFALDAMHDLRASPRRELGDPTLRMLRRVRRTLRELWQDPHVYYSYYRRAVRPNELFFVYRPADRELLRVQVEGWMSSRGGGSIQPAPSRGAMQSSTP